MNRCICAAGGWSLEWVACLGSWKLFDEERGRVNGLNFVPDFVVFGVRSSCSGELGADLYCDSHLARQNVSLECDPYVRNTHRKCDPKLAPYSVTLMLLL